MKLEQIVLCNQKELMQTLCGLYRGKIANYKSGKYLLVKGSVPVLLIAHLDTVHTNPVKDICMSHDGNILMSPQGIGGDDRCGVYALMQLYSGSSGKPWLLFTCDEEIGGKGANAFAADYKSGTLSSGLNAIRLLIEIDRKGRDEAVYYDCDNPELEDYITSKGFVTDFGTYSDISTIAPVMGVAAVNLSSGYYNPHTLHEYINRKHLNETIAKVDSILADAGKKDFKSFEYIEAVYEPHSWHDAYWKSPYLLDWYDKESVPKDVPEYYRDAYAELLDFYTVAEIEEYRAAYGNEVIDELYDIEFGEVSSVRHHEQACGEL